MSRASANMAHFRLIFTASILPRYTRLLTDFIVRFSRLAASFVVIVLRFGGLLLGAESRAKIRVIKLPISISLPTKFKNILDPAHPAVGVVNEHL